MGTRLCHVLLAAESCILFENSVMLQPLSERKGDKKRKYSAVLGMYIDEYDAVAGSRRVKLVFFLSFPPVATFPTEYIPAVRSICASTLPCIERIQPCLKTKEDKALVTYTQWMEEGNVKDGDVRL